jgi:uncharacterized protein YlxW (UPF0749 family)
MNKRPEWQVPVFIVFLFLGILLSVQFQVQQNYLDSLAAQGTENLVAMIRNFYEKKETLLSERSELLKQKQAFEEGLAHGENAAANLTKETIRMKTASGAAPVEGPGIEITFPANSPIVYLDLIDIVNELWTSGAEAIAINGLRVTQRTAIYYGESDTLFITVNGRILSFPVVIQAIGNAQALEAGLRLTGGIIDDLAVFKAYPEIKQVELIKIPASTTNLSSNSFARPN